MFRILEQWKSVLPEEHILRIEDPNTIVDVMLGALSLLGAGNDLNSFVEDLQSREQIAARVSQTRTALEGLSRRTAGNRTRVSGLPAAGGEQKGGSSHRL